MANRTVHGGVEGGRSQAGAGSRRSQMVVQNPDRTKPQGRVERGRSHDGDMADDTLGTTDGDGAMETKVELTSKRAHIT